MITRRLAVLAVTAVVLGSTLQCSIAPLIVLAANRIVLAEVFSAHG